MVRIVVAKYGRVPDEELFPILDIMEECYAKLMPHEISLIDLYVFESSSLARSILLREYEALGVSPALFFEETFFAAHDAWRGIPRITLFLDKMSLLPKIVRVGGIHHEVGHTVLHGSLEYYLLALPVSLLQTINEFNIPLEYARNMLYLISIAVKDYEVTRLLYTHGYVDDQVEYIKFLLKDNEDEILSWGLSKGDPLLEALHILSLLKVVGCAAPLLMDKIFGDEIKAALIKYLNHLPEDLSKSLINIAEKNFTKLGSDTNRNINEITENCIAILNEIFRRAGAKS